MYRRGRVIAKPIGILTLLFCVFYSALAFAQKVEIEWLASDFPPCHFHDNINKGYCDEIGEQIFAELDEFQFVKNISSLARYRELMKTQKKFCTLELLYSERRAEFLHFSEPLYPILPVGLVTRKNAPLIAQLRSLPADERMANLRDPAIRIGVVEGRFYGKYIDKYLKHMPDKIYIAKSYDAILQLLNAGKIDVTFFNPVELPVYDEHEKLEFMRVVKAPLLLTYLSCTKSNVGEAIISKVNSLLASEKFGNLRQHYEDWLRENERKIYRRLVREQCLKYDVVNPCPSE